MYNGTASSLSRIIKAGISVFVAPKLRDLDSDELILKYSVEAWQEHVGSTEYGFRLQNPSYQENIWLLMLLQKRSQTFNITSLTMVF